MKIRQRLYSENSWSCEEIDYEVQLVLAFLSPSIAKKKNNYVRLQAFFPNADIIMVSTAGEIHGTDVRDESISVTALSFDNTPIKLTAHQVRDASESENIGKRIAKDLHSDALKYMVTFIDGLGINGEYFLHGLESVLHKDVGITGGMAGDGFDPHKTYVSLNSEVDENYMAVAVGFYGDAIKIGNSSIAGFDRFGIERQVTKASENIVYELDHEPILDLYKNYLGKQADHLPGSGVNFPLSISKQGKEDWLLRSILTIDTAKGSIMFSGNVPEGSRAYLMQTNFDNLITKAGEAAELAMQKNHEIKPEFALLISCAGRRIILQQRSEEEVAEIRDIIGDDCAISGFYSYGEIGIGTGDSGHELHNETMTVALFSEV